MLLLRDYANVVKEGQGVIDVTAEEHRGLLYVITCENQHGMLYDNSNRNFRDLGPASLRREAALRGGRRCVGVGVSARLFG